MMAMAGCSEDKPTETVDLSVPHEGRWGIYSLNLSSQETDLLYSTESEISAISLSNSGTHLVFTISTQGVAALDSTSEIYLFDIPNGQLSRITDNSVFDAYPSFAPDDSSVVFRTLREGTLDLYVMETGGGNQRLLYDSGGHDADVDWGNGGQITFTRDHQIWTVNSDGTDPTQITDPDSAGTWGIANLPIGDYDPRFSPDGSMIAFERMVDVGLIHGGYDIFVAHVTGGLETRLTVNGTSGCAQGFPSWSHAGDRLVYIVSAVGSEGRYDLYMMNADGGDNRNITPAYYPQVFLCHNAVFSHDDTKVYFIGQWWS